MQYLKFADKMKGHLFSYSIKEISFPFNYVFLTPKAPISIS